MLKKELISFSMGPEILVIGDSMLDIYIEGMIDRISPEAPVPILSHHKTSFRLGGAANLAANLKSLGGSPTIITLVGDDAYARELNDLLLRKNIKSEFVSMDGIVTTTKTRVLNAGSHMLRIDNDNIRTLNENVRTAFKNGLSKYFKRDLKAVVISDYNKGFLTEDLIYHIQNLAYVRQIPVFVDPKKFNFDKYKNIACLKPNMKEFADFIGAYPESIGSVGIWAHMQKVLSLLNLEALIVTDGDKGAYLVEGLDKHYINAPALGKDFKDPCGAGDTFMAALVLGFLKTNSYIKSVRFAIAAASSVCKHVGVAEANLDEIKALNHGRTFFA